MTSETTVDHPLSYAHLLRLSDAFGVVEHARGIDPLTVHGYCLDDVARALVVLARDPNRPPMVEPLFTTSVEFVLGAFTPDGRAHNRRAYGTDRWTDGAFFEFDITSYQPLCRQPRSGDRPAANGLG